MTTTILGIETSCDETAAAIVVNGNDVRSNVVASQVDLHRKFGGVVPEIASRAHIECFQNVVDEAIKEANMTWPQIDAIAVTQKPGLVGSLLIGVTAAKTLSWAWDKPLIAVDHIHAHAVSAAIDLPAPPWPAVGLIVSGGHTSLFLIRGFRDLTLLGATQDDAAGEAFDKVASMLGLSYPGGPEIQRAAEGGDPHAIRFPRTLLGRDSLDFSFSGLKTAVLYTIHGKGKTTGGLATLDERRLADIAASFQMAVVDVLVQKTMRAVAQTGVNAVVIGGGVAANRLLRETLESTCRERELSFFAAPMPYCVDNAAMIASLGYYHFAAGEVADLAFDAASGS